MIDLEKERQQKSVAVTVGIGDPVNGMVKYGELYDIPGSVIALNRNVDRTGFKRNDPMHYRTAVSTASGNLYLIQRGMLINAKRSIEEGRLVTSDLWGSEATRNGVDITVGEHAHFGKHETSTVTAVLLQTGTVGPADPNMPLVPDGFAGLDAELAHRIPDYNQQLESAVATYDARLHQALGAPAVLEQGRALEPGN